MAKRPLSLTLGGIILVGQSLLSLFMVIGVVVAIIAGRHSTSAALALVPGLSLVLTAAAAIGIFRLRPWARMLVIVLSALGLCMAGTLALVGLIMAQMTAKSEVNLPMMLSVSLLSLSAWWLYLLNTASVTQQFGLSTAQIPGRTGRPLSISIIAILLFCGPLSVFQMWRLPASMSWVLGVPVSVWIFRTYYLLFIGLGVWLGIGLWRLRPLARIGTIAYLIFGMISTALQFLRMPISSFTPALQKAQLSAEQLAAMQSSLPLFVRGIMITTLCFEAAQLWFLVTRRAYFVRDSMTAHPPST